MQIRQVRTRRDLRAFIDLPYRLYRSDANWVPPLRSELAKEFDPARNPSLGHCTTQLFLLEAAGKVVGRVAAFVDHIAADHWGEPVGLFGYFENTGGRDGAELLLVAARDWLKGQGMQKMRGPWTFVSQEWGLVVEGFAPRACVMSPQNPPHYQGEIEGFGLAKIKDLLVAEVDAAKGYTIPQRILDSAGQVAARTGVTVRHLDLKQLDREVGIINDLSNDALNDNWGYAPVTPEEVDAMARDLKPIIHTKGVVFAEDRDGRPIGLGVAIPDINVILSRLGGRLFPLGWLRLLWGLPRLKQYRMFALGVIPEYQGKAVDSLIYKALYDALYSPQVRLEINYVLEDNAVMNNAIARLGATPLRRYRIYQMDI